MNEFKEVKESIEQALEEMIMHIKSLTRIIDKQVESSERLQRNLYNMERQISVLHFKIGKLEGMRDRDI
jgi:septal ring factor EnvC (AmiA/AmiB activator)